MPQIPKTENIEENNIALKISTMHPTLHEGISTMHTTLQEKFIEVQPTQVLPPTQMMPPTQEEISTMLHTLQYENSTMHPRKCYKLKNQKTKLILRWPPWR